MQGAATNRSLCMAVATRSWAYPAARPLGSGQHPPPQKNLQLRPLPPLQLAPGCPLGYASNPFGRAKGSHLAGCPLFLPLSSMAVDTLGIEPRASRMLSRCDTTTPSAHVTLCDTKEGVGCGACHRAAGWLCAAPWPGRTRARSLWLRRPTPYPRSHRGHWQPEQACLTKPSLAGGQNLAPVQH